MPGSKRYRLNLLVLVDAEDDEAVGKIGEEIYARFAKPMQEVDGVYALFPVADIKPDPWEQRGAFPEDLPDRSPLLTGQPTPKVK